ncbi:MAG: Vitamin B12 dependent methionine synthase activation subunit [Clostridia bacterium]|nr:Vitamin B12 dependent methionine synthase activation subunit [Clostridia bacterium]
MNDNRLYTLSCTGAEICIDKGEAYRYMGLKRDYEDPEFEKIYGECLCETEKNIFYKAAYRKSSLTFGEGDRLVFDFCSFESKDLKKNLEGCRYVYVFAATVGMGIDRLLMRYGAYSDLRHLAAECIASSAIECFCDRVNGIIAEGKDTKPRFSLGYGDTELIYQKDLLAFLDGEKTLGITLNGSMMMTPRKSVTAFIGVK